jgi:hypothetical protein
MTLQRWTRVGILASVLWFITGALYGNHVHTEQWNSAYKTLADTCNGDPSSPYPTQEVLDCEDYAWRRSEPFRHGLGKVILMYSLMPILFAWVFAIMLIAVTRSRRTGSAREPT